MYFKQIYSTPLGELLLVGTETELVGAWFTDQKYFAPDLSPEKITAVETPVLEQARAWLTEYFSGQIPTTKITLAPQVTPFRQRVLQQLQQIPYGTTVTYQELANQLASHPRAIGGAVAHNPLSLFIPCHRVLASDGSLHGYAGGLDRKQALLELEQIL
ncbi:methylated-DNA--[protein]-cysteine S-methyltransferase [Ligilactobacillus murinus]|uniref:methylated-DNA--[protein]-cysteine S-methyltransferase n=1 Tax=Ligilactobacillus murinus TaxID=1622 RepID=UPI00296B37F5|nr:methylated-DNA--[protein]-cysteine S-methyltransferase [Ligilactobacillus murinus]WOY88800.1 methylated-DNA--[protein]-cysteine S-methyltransferase [Ligilactobacillus murinus]